MDDTDCATYERFCRGTARGADDRVHCHQSCEITFPGPVNPAGGVSTAGVHIGRAAVSAKQLVQMLDGVVFDNLAVRELTDSVSNKDHVITGLAIWGSVATVLFLFMLWRALRVPVAARVVAVGNALTGDGVAESWESDAVMHVH